MISKYKLGLSRIDREQIIDAIISTEKSISSLETEIKNKKENSSGYKRILSIIQMISKEKELLKQALEIDKKVHKLFGILVMDNKR